MVRLQISYNDFFNQIGTSTFIDKFASVLGITQDTIRIVSIYEGSTVVYFGVTASSSTSSSDTTKQLAQVNDQFNYQLQIIQVFSIIKFNHNFRYISNKFPNVFNRQLIVIWYMKQSDFICSKCLCTIYLVFTYHLFVV